MKPFWKSVWITPAASGAVAPLRDRPGPGLLRAGGQVGLQAEGVEADPGQDVQAGLVDVHLGQELPGLVGLHLDQLGLDLGVQEDRLGRGDEGAHPRLQLLVGQLVGVAVEDVDERLGGQQEQLAQRPAVQPGGEDRRGRSPAPRAPRCTRGERRQLVLVDPGFLLQPRQRPLDGLQVGQDQLGGDGLDVAGRVDRAVDVGDVGVA